MHMFDKDAVRKTAQENNTDKTLYTVPVKERNGADIGAAVNFHISIIGDPPNGLFDEPKNKTSTQNWRQIYTRYHEGPIPSLENYTKFSAIINILNNNGRNKANMEITKKALPSNGIPKTKKSFQGAKLLARLRRESRIRTGTAPRTRQPIAASTARRATLQNYAQFKRNLSDIIDRYDIALSDHVKEDLLIQKYIRMKYWSQDFQAK